MTAITKVRALALLIKFRCVAQFSLQQQEQNTSHFEFQHPYNYISSAVCDCGMVSIANKSFSHIGSLQLSQKVGTCRCT